MGDAITIQNFHKAYGGHTAVHDISFAVQQGEIFGIIGPNGAGKTSTIECIIGLREPTSGTIRVLGHDPITERQQVQRLIGVQLQQAALPDRLHVQEALELFGALYPKTISTKRLLEQWGLWEKRHTAFRHLSGGQQQRLFIALSMIHNPEIVFLDELTTGLDPQARQHTWEAIAAIREQGKTVVLVTHTMEEAEYLCDRIAIIDHGRLVALDTPSHLIASIGTEQCVRFRPNRAFDPQMLHGVPDISRVQHDANEVRVYGWGSLLARVASTLADHNILPQDLRNERASLNDVFMQLTGREIRS